MKSCLRSSEYTKEALNILSPNNNIELFVADEDLDEINASSYQGVPVFHHHWLTRAHAREKFDLFVYQIENHSRAHFVKCCLSLWPGLTFFHDTNLNRVYFHALKHSTGGTDFNAEMDRMFNKTSIRFGDWHVRGWPLEILDSFYVRGDEEVKNAGAIAVFSERMKDEIREISKSPIPIRVAPRHISRAADMPQDKNPQNQYTIGIAGATTLEDRSLQILESLLYAKKQSLDFQVHWFVHDEFEERQIEETIRLFILNEESFKDLIKIVFVKDTLTVSCELKTTDVLISLTHSPRKGPPHTSLIAEEMGIPVITGETGPGLDILSERVFKVGMGPGDRGQLNELLSYLVKNNVRFDNQPLVHRDPGADSLQTLLIEVASQLSSKVSEHGNRLLAAKDSVLKEVKEQTSSTDLNTFDSKFGNQMVENVSKDFMWNKLV
jgi:hypothetical protein